MNSLCFSRSIKPITNVLKIDLLCNIKQVAIIVKEFDYIHPY